MTSLSIKTPLLPGNYYHIFNRGNNKEKIFHKEEHYQYFLGKYKEIICPHVETFAYCLLPNHFHLLLRIKEDYSDPDGFDPSHQFRRFFQVYAIWFNNQEARRGSLFTKYFRRIEISDDKYLLRLIRYIHLNPRKHGLGIHFTDYPYSSLRLFLDMGQHWLAKNEVLSWFGDDYVAFFRFHQVEEETDRFDCMILEDR